MTSKSNKIAFWVIVLLLFLYRYYALIHFGFRYTDSDQAVMWTGTIDFANGEFHEPRFYGQDYNTMLESLLAVPFYKLGMPLKYALPLVTSVLALFPYLLLAGITFKRRSQSAGLLILGFVFLLPLDFDFITSLSRGFVTGIAVASLLFLLLFKDVKRYGWIFAGLIAVVSWSVSANSLLVIFPMMMYFWLNNIRNRNFYIFTLIGAVAGLSLHLMIRQFYVLHPETVLHYYTVDVKPELLTEGLKHLDKFLNPVVPLFFKAGWMLLPLALTAGFILLRNKLRNEALVAFSVIPLIILPLILSKVHDGNNSLFFSAGRMYLGIPLIFAFLIAFSGQVSRRLLLILLVAASGIAVLKMRRTESFLGSELQKQPVISMIENSDLQVECAEINRMAERNNVGLVVISDHWYYDFYTYACKSCEEKFPNTIRPSYDRRIWRLREDSRKVYENIILIDLKQDLSLKHPEVRKLGEKQGFYILKGNKKTTMKLLKELDIPVRGF